MKQQLTIKSRIDDIVVDVFIPNNWDNKKMVLCCHGFSSGKGSPTYAVTGESLLKSNIAYAIFSLPYHAERRNDYKDFTIKNCIEDTELVEKTIREKYPNTKIGILGTSFGGYLTLLRLKMYKHNYYAIVLRSPAIKMDEILRNNLTDSEFEEFKSKGYAYDNNKVEGMKIPFPLYEELANKRIMDDPLYEEKILIFHGTVDDTAPYEDVVEFANMNKNVTLISLKDENHRYSQEGLERFCKEISEYMKNEE